MMNLHKNLLFQSRILRQFQRREQSRHHFPRFPIPAHSVDLHNRLITVELHGHAAILFGAGADDQPADLYLFTFDSVS